MARHISKVFGPEPRTNRAITSTTPPPAMLYRLMGFSSLHRGPHDTSGERQNMSESRRLAANSAVLGNSRAPSDDADSRERYRTFLSGTTIGVFEGPLHECIRIRSIALMDLKDNPRRTSSSTPYTQLPLCLYQKRQRMHPSFVCITLG